MKQLLIILSLCTCVLMAKPASAQDFFGAANTGRHTVGVNFKYDGDFWLGAHYNLRRFPVFGLKSNFDVNMIGELKIDKGLAGFGTELGFGHVVADGKDFSPGFGLGLRYGLRYEYCSGQYDDAEVEAFSNTYSRLSAKFEIKPGGYGLQYSIAPTIRTDVVSFYFQPSIPDYNKDGKSSKIEFKYLDKLVVGVHADYTTAKFLGSGTQYHLTADVEETIYFGVKSKRAWNTWSGNDNYKLDADYPEVDENEGSCVMPDKNLQIRMSHSMRF